MVAGTAPVNVSGRLSRFFVDYDRRGQSAGDHTRSLDVDGHMRAADGLWAIGDITGKGAFTHMSMYQARVAGDAILGVSGTGAEYHAVPRLVFAAPEVAAVGMTARDAEEDGEVRTRSASVGIDASSRAWLHDANCVGFVKLVADCHPSLIHISNLLAEKPRGVPHWAQASSERVVRAVPFLAKRLQTGGKD